MNETLTFFRKDLTTYQVSVSRGSQRQTLMADDYIDVIVESHEPVDFHPGDKTMIFGAIYSINQLPGVEKLSEDLYVYNLRIEGIIYDLLKAQFLLFDNTGVAIEGVFDLMADLQKVLALLVANLNRVYGAGSYVLGEVPTTAASNHTFSSENCLAVLQRMCTHYKVEFSIVWQQGALHIEIGHVGIVKGFSLQYGQGKGLYKLSRRPVSEKNVFSRLFAYGSDKNLPLHYRSFSRRLKLPGVEQSYIEDAAAINTFGLIETTKIFEDIFPRRTGVVSSVADKQTFTDLDMDFDLNLTGQGNTLYLIDGNSAKVSFITGNLAGYEFEISSYNHDTKTFRIKPFTDDRGMEFPGDSAAFRVAAGDQYVLLDIRLPATYVVAAEAELLARATEYLNQGRTAKAQYSCEIEPIYARQEALEIRPGDSIPVEDTGLNINRHFRILTINRDLIEPYRWNIELGDEVAVSNLTRLYQQAVEVNKIVQRNNMADPAVYRQSWRTTRELESMIFDQDNYFDTGKIRPLSIETGMLTVGAKAGQFVLNAIVFQPNFNAVANRLQSTAGTLSHYAVEDEIRTWNVAAFDQTLPDNNARYIYIRCQMQGTVAEVRLEAAQLKVDAAEGHYTFLVGVLHSVQNTFRRISLTYGATVVHGREIVTGRISSTNGLTYFDLDQGEIGGRIVFRSGKTDQQIESEIGAAQGTANTAQSTASAAQGTANTAQSTASAAQTAASNAQTAANTANAAITDITSDNVLSAAEKPAQRLEWNVVFNEKAGINAEAISYGLTVENSNYNNQWQNLANYLNGGTIWVSGVPLWLNDDNLSVNTTIVGATYRNMWANMYNRRIMLLNAISARARVLANAAQATANTAQTAASTAQTAASTAQTAANTANAAITNIISDNVLSAAEKPEQRLKWNTIAAERAGISAQASDFGISNMDYNNSFFELANYLNNGTAWVSGVPLWLSDAQMATNTTIVGSAYRAAWELYFTSRTALLNAIADRARVLANAAQASADSANYLKTALQGSTEIAGGLVATNLLLMRDAVNAITGGMSGLTDDNIGIWTGGTYQQALAAAAKVILRKDGSGHLSGGRILWNPAGDLNVGDLSIDASGTVVIRDAGAVVRAMLTRGEITTLASIIGSTQNNTVNNPGNNYTINHGHQTNDMPNLIVVNNNNSLVTIACQLTAHIISSSVVVGVTDASVFMDLEIQDTLTGQIIPIDGNGSSITPSATHSQGGLRHRHVNLQIVLPAGTYRLRVRYTHATWVGPAAFDSSVSASTVHVFFDGAQQRTEIGRNGVGIIGNATNYSYIGMHNNVYHVVEKCTGVYDRPGLLATASVSSLGVQSNGWGRWRSPNNATHAATGTYDVPHTLNRTNYMVVVTPIGDGVMATVASKSSNSFRVMIRDHAGTLTNRAFDYMMTGQN